MSSTLIILIYILQLFQTALIFLLVLAVVFKDEPDRSNENDKIDNDNMWIYDKDVMSMFDTDIDGIQELDPTATPDLDMTIGVDIEDADCGEVSSANMAE